MNLSFTFISFIVNLQPKLSRTPNLSSLIISILPSPLPVLLLKLYLNVSNIKLFTNLKNYILSKTL